MKIRYPEGATPLSPEEMEGLRLTYITTQDELNIAEQENIAEAETWINKARTKKYITTEFIKKLHNKMFGNVWTWAGSFRTSDKNIGVAWETISVELRNLCDDCDCWINEDTFEPDEIAARFSHRLVKIHPFPNGNGRASRLMADTLLRKVLKTDPFTWGSENLTDESDCRSRYIAALKAADRHNYKLLFDFVRS